MNGISSMRDVGSYIKPVVGVKPTDDTGTVINGAAIDRTGFESCVLHVATGVATGAPTAQTLDAKLQDSDTSGGTFVDIVGAAITQIAADDGVAEVDVDLSIAKAFIRVVQTMVLTAGTTPRWPVKSDVILGGAVEVPA